MRDALANTPIQFAADQVEYVDSLLRGQPFGLDRFLRSRWDHTAQKSGFPAAHDEMRGLLRVVEQYDGELPANAKDSQVRAWATRHADGCNDRMIETGGDEMDAYAAGRAYCDAVGIEAPIVNEKNPVISAVLRMRCGRWWRRQARRAFGRRIEQRARAIGAVNGQCQHVSGDGLARWQERQRENRDMLESTTMECRETGERINLADAVDAGQANPKNRRGEMMMRVRGLEECANERGHVAIFATWTLPPEYHALHSKTGRLLKGRHITPRDGQAWLMDQWKRCRSALARRKISAYGVRVVEPHHDGSPHWHFLLFVPRDQLDSLTGTLREYIVNGATSKKRRKYAFDCERIDTTRGSAVGYISKYIGKNIDGHAVGNPRTRGTEGDVIETDDAGDKSERVRAWASQWGIKQFQFYGAPPAGVWREMRRMKPVNDSESVEALRDAADDGRIGEWMELMGGPAIPRNERPARVGQRYTGETGRYGDQQTRAVVEAMGREYVSRPYTWDAVVAPSGESTQRDRAPIRVSVCERHTTIEALQRREDEFQREWSERSGEAASTWTRGNNCTRGDDGRHKTGCSAASGIDPGRRGSAGEVADAGGGPGAGGNPPVVGRGRRSGGAH